MAAHYSKKVDEPASDILNHIHKAFIANLGERSFSSGDLDLREEFASKSRVISTLPNVQFEIYEGKMRFILNYDGDLPNS